ncbi:MAG: hypothetical protein JWM11_7218 [Planctomycetaceae bacterium]|nr:hypothetical protein [Planctomycetaceae bacterium]
MAVKSLVTSKQSSRQTAAVLWGSGSRINLKYARKKRQELVESVVVSSDGYDLVLGHRLAFGFQSRKP